MKLMQKPDACVNGSVSEETDTASGPQNVFLPKKLPRGRQTDGMQTRYLADLRHHKLRAVDQYEKYPKHATYIGFVRRLQIDPVRKSKIISI
jgi:hypothetical protein